MEEWYRKLDVIRAVNVGAISAAALYGRTDSGIATFKEILRAVDELPSAQPTLKGWVCPLCGRGLSPLTMVCPCQNGKGVEDNMQDLISRQAAIDAIKELCEHYTPTKSVTHPHMDFVIEELEALPSAQPEIIRCKNCKHRHYLDNEPYCASTITFGWADDDYCSYAERREG